MFHKVYNSFHPLLFLFIVILLNSLFAVVQSSNECGTCIENTQLTDLIKKFDMLQTEMKTQRELSSKEIKDLKSEVDQLKSENKELKANLSKQDQQILQQDQKILQLEKEISKQKPFGPPNKPSDSCTKKVDNEASKKKEKSSSRALEFLPTSCEELRKEGHFANGVYLVLNEETNKIDAVLCQFLGAKQVGQESIGTVDVRTKNIHFYVQRESNFGTGSSAVIPFDVAPVNEGDAFDLPTGIFTVPVSGIYHFDLSAMKDPYITYLAISLQVNGDAVGTTLTQQSDIGTWEVISLSASLRLAAGDRVNLYNVNSGVLSDSSEHFTHFSGWLVEEDLM